MKKRIKLKDITNEQYDKWKQGCENRACENCPIRMVNCAESSGNYSWIDDKGNFSDKFLDQEIEIDVEDEKIQLTDDEKAILESLLSEKYKYITRDEYDDVRVHKRKPKKGFIMWCNDLPFYDFIDKHYFQCVQWGDKEPTLIEDLLKGENK